MHVHGRLQATCRRPSASSMHTRRWRCHQGVIKYYLLGMCSNSNVWLETRTQASPTIRGHAHTSNHHPSKNYLTTTTQHGDAVTATHPACMLASQLVLVLWVVSSVSIQFTSSRVLVRKNFVPYCLYSSSFLCPLFLFFFPPLAYRDGCRFHQAISIYFVQNTNSTWQSADLALVISKSCLLHRMKRFYQEDDFLHICVINFSKFFVYSSTLEEEDYN